LQNNIAQPRGDNLKGRRPMRAKKVAGREEEKELEQNYLHWGK